MMTQFGRQLDGLGKERGGNGLGLFRSRKLRQLELGWQGGRRHALLPGPSTGGSQFSQSQ